MARIPYVDPATGTPDQQEYCKELLSTRGRLSHIFLALANVPPLGRGVLAMATSLRRSTVLPRRYREIAVVAVGIETGADYELQHHWHSARQVGISQEQLLDLPRYQTSPLFTQEEKAIVDFAIASTRHCKVPDAVWEALAFLGDDGRLELTLTVAWYNCVARTIHALDLEMDANHPDQGIPPGLAFAGPMKG